MSTVADQIAAVAAKLREQGHGVKEAGTLAVDAILGESTGAGRRQRRHDEYLAESLGVSTEALPGLFERAVAASDGLSPDDGWAATATITERSLLLEGETDPGEGEALSEMLGVAESDFGAMLSEDAPAPDRVPDFSEPAEVIDHLNESLSSQYAYGG